jgi:hypothetical protein
MDKTWLGSLPRQLRCEAISYMYVANCSILRSLTIAQDDKLPRSNDAW